MTMLETARRFLRDQSGSTAIEYGLIAAGISLGIISTLAAMRGKLTTTFTSAQDGLK